MLRKKILHIQVLPKLSGVQKVSLEIMRGLPDEEYEKWILFSESTEKGNIEECIKQFELAGVRVILSSNLRREIGLKDLPAMLEIYQLCRKEKFDIVHTHSTKPGIIGRIGAYFGRVPMIVHTVHGLAFHDFIKFPTWQFYWICEMFSSLFCDKIILVNQFYSKYFAWFKNKILTIYNGMDFLYLPLLNNPKELASNSIKILYIGRLDTQKDPITLLNAMDIVVRKHPQVTLTIVGDGEKYDECSAFIKAKHLENNIALEGWQTDVSKYYSTYDIFAMSSIYESFGLIFLEAGYYKLPVIATNVEGIPEVVKDGETGLLSNPKDPEALAKNMIRLIENPDLRVSMGERGYERVITHFSSQRMVSQYKQIYDSLSSK